MESNQGPILLVEDSEDDVFFMRRAFKEAGLTERLEVVWNGEEAINYLGGIAEYADRTRFPLPKFVFLDLKMPIMNGFDVLSWLRDQTHLNIPVAVLSSSPEEQDMKRARALGAACYLIKPPTAAMLRGCWKQFDLAARKIKP
jgi:CheY-like chemotaxis protein